MKRIITFILCAVLAIGIISPEYVSCAEGASNNLGALQEVTVSDSTPEIGDTLTFSFVVKIPEGKEVASVGIYVKNGCGPTTGNQGTYDISTETNLLTAEWSCEVEYYGTWYVDEFCVWYADGDCLRLVDDQYGQIADDVVRCDMTTAYATVANKPDDASAPIIDISSFVVSPSSPGVDEYVCVGVDIEDECGVVYVYSEFLYGSGNFLGTTTSEYVDGQWKLNVPTSYAGLVQLVSITAVDRCGNSIIIYNSKCDVYEDVSNEADLSGADVFVVGGAEGDVSAPVIDLSTLSVAEKNIERQDKNKIQFKINDESSIKAINISVVQGKGPSSTTSGMFVYDTKTGFYVGEYWSTEYYGLYEIIYIEVIDINGNSVIVGNSQLSVETDLVQDDWQMVDLSCCNFNVGIQDVETGIFVSGNGMDDDATLTVEPIEDEDSNYDVLIEEDRDCEGYYNISMGGTYNDNDHPVRVQFDVSKLNNGQKHKDGDKLKIRHKRKDGSIQEKEVEVKDGKIWIDVNEFSPFMVLSEEQSGDKPQVVVPSGATISSSGVYVTKMDRTGITAGVVTQGNKEYAEYSWWACEGNSEQWFLIQDWTLGSEWLNWTPDKFGDYVIVGKVRLYDQPNTECSSHINISYHPQIKGKCQMPYTGEGGGYLIGVESYENPNQSYMYEMLVLDCTLLAEGKDAWIYTTGKFTVPQGNAAWTIWQPQYGYYWTLFRVYDAQGNLLDEQCYGFVNAY